MIKPGDHISFNAGIHSHHGIYCGDIAYKNRDYKNIVIHFESKLKSGEISCLSLDQFAQRAGNRRICIRQYQEGTCHSPEEVIRRAVSRLGETNYNLLLNNCEHFANWCKTGKNFSRQVNRSKILGLGGILLVTPLIPGTLTSIGLIAAYGYVIKKISRWTTKLFIDFHLDILFPIPLHTTPYHLKTLPCKDRVEENRD